MLKAQWWELWWVKPGTKPVFIRMYGEPIPHWVPDGCFPTRALALKEKRARKNRYDRVYRIRRYNAGDIAAKTADFDPPGEGEYTVGDAIGLRRDK